MNAEENFSTLGNKTDEELETLYWEELSTVTPLYGADVDHSLSNENLSAWNFRKLGTILSDNDENIEGITSPYLYIGMWMFTFPVHTEDYDLYSVDFLHRGAPKL